MTSTTPPMTPDVAASRPADTSKSAALAGAASAALALGITELVAGLTDKVPSAIASVGTFVVEYTPSFVERFAINVFGTADKGALAVGTVVIGVMLGAFVGWGAQRKRWIGALAFGLFALLGIAATFAQPSYDPILTFATIAGAAAVGWFVLDRLLSLLQAPAIGSIPAEGVPNNGGRRRFVAGVTGVGFAALAAGLVGRSLIVRRSEEVRASIDLPQAAKSVPPPGPGTSFPNVEGLTPLLVPNENFYRIDTALIVPRPDTETWRLRIKGMVETELEYTLSDLMAMPLYERYITISCVSNDVGGRLVGNAKWTGVRLSELLDRAGVRPGADQVVGRSVDGWTAGFPTDVVFDGREPLVAIGMNGEMLPPRSGYPARLIVPGLYGYVSATKWLEEIELTTWEDFDGYWVPRGWSKEGPIKTQSRIDVPQANEGVAGGTVVVAGVAWAPLLRIEKVEIRVDGGEWQTTTLSEPLSDAAWVQWRHEVELPAGGEYRVEVRATDGTGETQTAEESSPAPDGATGHHMVHFKTV